MGKYEGEHHRHARHMDFLAEVYRSLSVLDGAILLISAKDGVQAQTHILFHALRKIGIPTIFLSIRLTKMELIYQRFIRILKRNFLRKL